MAKYRLSQLAFEDFKAIFKYTVQTHGLRQAEIYREGLKSSCRNLSENPEAGENAHHIHCLYALLYTDCIASIMSHKTTTF